MMPSRTRKQRETRRVHVALICKKLKVRLSHADEETRIHSTNRLLPVGTLKRRCLRNLFGGWIDREFRGMGRCFTCKLSKEVCRRLRKSFGLETLVPEEEWIRMHNLLKVARKRRIQKPKPRKKKNMSGSPADVADTLPMDLNVYFDAELQEHMFQSFCIYKKFQEVVFLMFPVSFVKHSVCRMQTIGIKNVSWIRLMRGLGLKFDSV